MKIPMYGMHALWCVYTDNCWQNTLRLLKINVYIPERPQNQCCRLLITTCRIISFGLLCSDNISLDLQHWFRGGETHYDDKTMSFSKIFPFLGKSLNIFVNSCPISGKTKVTSVYITLNWLTIWTWKFHSLYMWKKGKAYHGWPTTCWRHRWRQIHA